MSYSRKIIPDSFPSGACLTERLIGCGFKLAGKPLLNANIEDMLFACSLEGMAGDFRALSLLVDWLNIHSEQVLAHRLYCLASSTSDKRVRAFWAAALQKQKADSRFKRFAKLYRGKRIDLLFSSTDFQLKRFGEDERFLNSPLRVAKGVGLRHRATDIMTQHELAGIHRAYYHRLIIGPTYRADMWAALELNPALSASELARLCYGSFATAWAVKHDWSIVQKAAA